MKYPTYRVDLEHEIDIIEEIARLDGYDKIPVKTPPQRIMGRHSYRIKKNCCGLFNQYLAFTRHLIIVFLNRICSINWAMKMAIANWK